MFKNNESKEYLKEQYSMEKNFSEILEKIGEEKNMQVNKVLKTVATFVITIGITVGIVYAGNTVYEKVFKKPEKIENFIEELKVTEQDLENIITEKEAIQKSIEEMKRYGYTINENEINSTEISKSPNYDEINYIIKTVNGIQIQINALTGKLIGFYIDVDYTTQELEKFTTTKENIIEIAKNKLKEFGYGEEYKLSYISSNYSDDESKSYFWYLWFSKEYDGLFNPTECISMTIIPQINIVSGLNIDDEPFENNPIIITEDEAINIAKEKDKIINTENYTTKEVKAELDIKRMRADVYLKENGYTNNGNEVKELEDGTIYSYSPFKLNGKPRKVYVVEIFYNDRPFNQTRKYYVDTTTGEVVGGEDIFDM